MKDKYQILILVGGLILILLMPFEVYYLTPTPSNDYLINTNYTCFDCDLSFDPTILGLLSVIMVVSVICFIISYYKYLKKEKGWFPVKVRDKLWYFKPPNARVNDVMLKCMCSDWRFRFEKQAMYLRVPEQELLQTLN